MIAAAFLALAVALGMVVGIFVYPSALRKNLDHPEQTKHFSDL